MAIFDLNSGYIGSPEKWRIFFEKFASSQELNDAYLEEIKFEEEQGYPISTHLSLEEFQAHLISKENFEYQDSDLISKSFLDFVRADGLAIFKYLNFKFCSLVEIQNFCELRKSNSENKSFFKELIFEDISDDLYYSYNDWQNNLEKYNGGCNPAFMSKNYNMMLGELGFGFPKNKKQTYDNAVVVGWDGNYASAFLLPDEKTKDGEMESWLIDAEDVYRFRSFAEMIIWNWVIRYGYKGADLTDFLKRIGVDEILDLDILASNAYVQAKT
jgi:hypothetical protein